MLGDSYAAGQSVSGTARTGDNQLNAHATWNGDRAPGASSSQFIDVAEYWRLAVKHRLIILGAFIAAMVLGTAATLMMTPIYTASATLQIDREAARVLNVDDVAPRESMIAGEEFFQTQYGIMRSRTLAERVVDSQGLATSDAFLQQMGITPPERGTRSAAAHAAVRRDLVIGVVSGNLGVQPVRGSRLVTISFDSPNPQLAAQIVNAFGENFIQANLDRKYEASSYARQFLEERIAQTKTRLENTERQLVAYAKDEQIINLTEGSGADAEATQSLTANNLATLNAALSQAQADRVSAEEKWRQARSAPLYSLAEVLQNPTVQTLTQERAKLDAEYQQKLSVYQPSYPEMLQLKAQIDELDTQVNRVAAGIRNSIQGQYVVAANREQSLRNRVDGLKGDVLDLRDRSVQYNILQRELDTSRTLYDALLQRYKEVSISGNVAANNISIIDRAQVPDTPSKPRLIINLLIAALLGLGLGFGAAFLIEALDETLATPEDVETKLNLAVLGVTPLLGKDTSPVEALADIRSPMSEAYYSLRTALQFSTPHGAPTSILVTSSRPAEGKSTTAYAIALNLARVGKRVLLADGDLRNPSMHRVMGLENDRGTSNMLAGAADLSDLVKPTEHANLHFMACGPLPPNPAELWAGDSLARLLEQASRDYDHLVIDGPPVLGFADAPVVAAAVDGTLFVLESRGTRRAQARGALRRLSMGRSRILGTVLTKFNTKTTQYGGYDYAYDYNYGAEEGGKKKVRRR